MGVERVFAAAVAVGVSVAWLAAGALVLLTGQGSVALSVSSLFAIGVLAVSVVVWVDAWPEDRDDVVAALTARPGSVGVAFVFGLVVCFVVEGWLR